MYTAGLPVGLAQSQELEFHSGTLFCVEDPQQSVDGCCLRL